jgi:hypothetical protein
MAIGVRTKLSLLVLISLISAPAASKLDQALATIAGSWSGQRQLAGFVETIEFTVGPDGSWLEIESRVNAGTMKVSPKNVEKDGSVTFTFAPQQLTISPRGNNPSLTTGQVNAVMNVHERTGSVRVFLRFPKEAGSKFNAPTVILTQPSAPSSPQRTFFERTPTFFSYRDWRSREQGAATPDELVRRLRANGIGPCLAQADTTVTEGQTSTITMNVPGIWRAFQIYSPSGDPGLTYGIATNPPMAGTVHGDNAAYPVVVVTPTGYFTGDVTISLNLRTAAPGSGEKRSIPVTVLSLGGTTGDYGPGCPLVK